MAFNDGGTVSTVNKTSNTNTPSMLLRHSSNNKKQELLFDWNKSQRENNFSRWCNFDNSNITSKQSLDDTKGYIKFSSISDNLFTKNYICKTDAIRVVKPVIPFVIKSIKNNSNAEVKKVPQLKTKYQTNFNVAKNLFDGTADDLNYCLKNTKLAGMGQIFIDAQNKYGINALFLMSIVKVESGYGNKPMKGKPYNIVGAVGQNPKSYKECIDKLGSNLKNNYIGSNLETIEKIRSKYCKWNKIWPDSIANEMGRLSNKIMERYKE